MAEPTSFLLASRATRARAGPSAVQGFVTVFQDHPRIEFVVFELAQFLADQEFKLALIGLHGDKPPTAVGARHHPRIAA